MTNLMSTIISHFENTTAYNVHFTVKKKCKFCTCLYTRWLWKSWNIKTMHEWKCLIQPKKKKIQDFTFACTCNTSFWFYKLSRIPCTIFCVFNFFFLCGEFRNFVPMYNFLECTFTNPILFLVFRFHISKAHSICRNIYDKSRVFIVALKKHTSLFSDRR